MKANQNQRLRISGMIAAVIVVVGVTVVIANSKVGGITGGVSADVKDIATGNVVVMSKETYDSVLAKLDEYYKNKASKTAQDNIVTEVVNMLKDVQK